MSIPSIVIQGRVVGPEHPSFVIAEIGQAHDGSLGNAHAYIDAAAKAGADAVKFQTHIAHAESTPAEKFRVNVFPQDATRFDYWRRMEFTKDQWAGLARHARDSGLVFLSTPFSFEAVELLSDIGIPAWKIGSGDITNLPMLDMVAQSGQPVILSSGMSTWADLDAAVACMQRHRSGFAILQCTTSYPCPPEKTGLNVMEELRRRYNCAVGLSDHSGAIFASLAAVTLGAQLIEVHTVFSKECFGPDVSSSLTTGELAQLVRGIRFVETALASPVQKDAEALARDSVKTLFGRSLFFGRDLQAGAVLERGDMTLKKPGTGIPAAQLDRYVGRRLVRPVARDEMLDETDFQPDAS